MQFPLIEKGTLETQMYQVLRTLILEGRLAGGERLVQDELAAKFGTSRIPVRDALKKLEHDSLVRLDGHGSYVVNSFGIEDLQEIYDLRALLESYAVVKVVTKLTDDDLVELEKLVDGMNQAGHAHDIERYVQLNQVFHMQLYEVGKEPRLLRMIKNLWSLSGVPKYTPATIPGQLEHSIVEHQMLLKALKDRDASAAEVAIRTHIQNAGALLLTHLQQKKNE